MRNNRVIKSVKYYLMEKIKLKFQIKMINNKWASQADLIGKNFTLSTKFLVKITLKMTYMKDLEFLA